jgi:hypothetical protein
VHSVKKGGEFFQVMRKCLKPIASLISIVFFLLSLYLATVSRADEAHSVTPESGSTEDPMIDEVLWVDADSDLGSFNLNHGFLHGRDENSPAPSESLVAALKPKEWRLYKARSYELAELHQANITYGLSNHYAWSQGGFPYAEPWEDWSGYEAYMLLNLQVYDSYFPDCPVEYYDIWSEPDHPYYWHGTYEQLLETFARCYNVVKSYNPEAKLVGPSISWFRPGDPGVEGIIDFLVDLDSIYGIRLDAISWHENGGTWIDTRPDGIPSRAQYLRSQIQAHFPAEYAPELHVNEFMGGRVHLSPGWNVGFLYYLDEAEIDKAMRACWWILSENPPDYWSDCWSGLNGMFMKDGQTPQPAYWVYLNHARMQGETKLHVWGSDVNTNIIATRNDSSGFLRLLVGRYLKTSPNDVTINLVNYPYSRQNVLTEIERIPNSAGFYFDPPTAMPLPGGPFPVSSELVPVTSGIIEIVLQDVEDGEAYIVTISAIRGDVNGDGVVDIGDVVSLVNYLFKNGSGPSPALAGDCNCDGTVDLGDVVYLINYLYKSGPAPAC